jgi:hypothetical protein
MENRKGEIYTDLKHFKKNRRETFAERKLFILGLQKREHRYFRTQTGSLTSVNQIANRTERMKYVYCNIQPFPYL